MSVIRAGHFVEFKGHEALLLDTDQEGLARLEAWARTLATGTTPQFLEQCSGIELYRGLRVIAEVAGRDIGLAQGHDGALLWRCTQSGWARIADQLAALRVADSGHQYLESGTDRIVPIASIGEYNATWWSEHAG